MQAERRQLVFGRGLWVVLGFVVVGVVLYLLRDVLTPIFLAFTIAYIFDPVVDRLEKWRIPRPLGIAIVLIGLLGGIAGLLLLVIPDIVRDIASVAKELPVHAKRLLARIEPFLTQQGIQVPHTADEWIARLKGYSDSITPSTLAPVGNVVKSVIGGTVSAIGAFFGALIVPILAVYLLYDFDRMVAGIRDLIPTRFRPTVIAYSREIDAALSQFMRGQLTVMAILAVLYGGAYSLLGVRLAIPIGIAAGVLNFIPYVGSAFALVAGILMTLIGGGSIWQLFGVVVAYAVVQTLEGFVLTPRIVGTSVGLREIWVLLALFVGGEVFGFLGVLLAVPVAAILKIFITHAIAHYRESNLFLAPAEELAMAGGVGAADPAAAMPSAHVLETEAVHSSDVPPPELAEDPRTGEDLPALAPEAPARAKAASAPLPKIPAPKIAPPKAPAPKAEAPPKSSPAPKSESESEPAPKPEPAPKADSKSESKSKSSDDK